MSSINRNSTKVRGHVFDSNNNQALAGCLVGLCAKSGESLERVVRVLSTDSNGYYSFDISTLEGLLYGFDRLEVGLLSKGVKLSSCSGNSHVVWDNARTKSNYREQRSFYSLTNTIFAEVEEGFVPNHSLESIQNPDLTDREILGKAAVRRAKAGIAGDCCNNLAPTDLSPREFYFNKIEFDLFSMMKLHQKYPDATYEGDVYGELVEDGMRRSLNDLATAIDNFRNGTDPEEERRILFEAFNTLSKYFRANKSKALLLIKEYRQTWNPEGLSLGDIAYSLALAPGESVNLAVIDWARNDEDSRQDSTAYTESLSHSQAHSRDIEEAVSATLEEFQSGYSSAGSFGGGLTASATIPIKTIPVKFGLNQGGQYGSASAKTSGSRNMTGTDVQRIADSVVQKSSLTRNLSSTVIVQSHQAVSNNLQTRTVSNNNHCHALTIQYFEVNRNYRVVTERVGERLALGVKIKTTEDAKFTEKDLLNYYHLFEPIFNGTIYEDGLKAALANKIGTKKEADFWDGDLKITQLIITLDVGEDGATNTFSDNFKDSVFLIVSLADQSTPLSIPIDGYYDSDGELIVVPWPVNIVRQQIVGLRLKNAITSHGVNEEVWDLESLKVEYDSINLKTGAVQNRKLLGSRGTHSFKGHETIPVTIDDKLSPKPESVDVPLSDDDKKVGQIRTNLLLDHMNENFLAYRKFLIANVDFESIWKFLAEPDFAPTEIDRTLSGFIADYAVFPINLSMDLIFDEYMSPKEKPETRYIGLPTRGVFAETMLSNCSACEKRDVTRYWDWQESPIKDATPITPVSQGDYTKEVDTKPTQLPNSVLNIVNPPTVSDPTGLANALTLLGKGDVFRDMSGLNELLKLSQEYAKKPFQELTAKEIVDKADAVDHYTKKADMTPDEKKKTFKKAAGIEDTPFAGEVSIRFLCRNIENHTLDGALVVHLTYGSEPEVDFVTTVIRGEGRGRVKIGPINDGDTLTVYVRLTVKNDNTLSSNGQRLAKVLLEGSTDFVFKRGLDLTFEIRPIYTSEEVTATSMEEAAHKFSYVPEESVEIGIPEILTVKVSEKGLGYDYTSSNSSSTEKKYRVDHAVMHKADDNINDLVGGVDISGRLPKVTR